MRRTLVLSTVLTLGACANATTPAPVYNALLEQRDMNTGAHMVSNGETIQQIAANYSMTIDDILRANSIGDPSRIAAGQRLFVPSPGRTTGPSPTLTTLAYNAPMTNDITMVEAPPLPVATTASDPILAEPLSPLASPAPAVPPPEAPVKLASAVPPEQWASPSASGFRWPVKGPTLSGFGQKADGLRNDGVNIGALEGAAVEAAADGEIVYTGQAVDGFGNLVLIKHKDNFVTAYGHLARIDVAKGQSIRAGQIIGGVGKTGSVSAPQLHFEIRKGTEIVDPMRYLAAGNRQTAGLYSRFEN